MPNDQDFVPSPLENESLGSYLKRLSNQDLQRIRSDPDSLKKFCFQLKGFKEVEQPEGALEKLWKSIERTISAESFLWCIKRVKSVRQNLLDTLVRNEEEIEKKYTSTNLQRLIFFAGDSVGVIAGLLTRDSYPGVAGWAFRAATCFGALGLLSTLSELNSLNTMMNDLMLQIQLDQEKIAPIKRWCQQSGDFDTCLKNVFPYNFSSHILAEFTNPSSSEYPGFGILATLIQSIAQQDSARLKDEGLIREAINFSSYPVAQNLCKWMSSYQYPIFLDIGRMAIQLQSKSNTILGLTVCQNVPALPLNDRNISSFTVWGRIGLNILSVVYSSMCLRSTRNLDLVQAMKHLREELSAELEALQSIAQFIESRRSS